MTLILNCGTLRARTTPPYVSVAALAGTLVLFGGITASARALTLVENGAAHAVLVLAGEPTMTAQYAARELVEHVRKATGVELAVATESAIPAGYSSRVFVGMTVAAQAQGLDVAQLEPDAFLLKTVGRDLYVLGRENPALDRFPDRDIDRSVVFHGYIPRRETQPSGTLFGVYELLGRFVSVRWLWPGALGTYVPAAARIHTPGVKMRQFGWQTLATDAQRGANPQLERHGFTRDGLRNYHRDKAIHLTRHRLGRSERHVRCRHEFTGWWERHGKEHPEWFMLNEEGERGPLPGRSTQNVAMCVSNPVLEHHRRNGRGQRPGCRGHHVSVLELHARARRQPQAASEHLR